MTLQKSELLCSFYVAKTRHARSRRGLKASGMPKQNFAPLNVATSSGLVEYVEWLCKIGCTITSSAGRGFKMDGPRLTEEWLRFHLDSNQVMRERLCLSILPLLGPYTRERPRRPQGGTGWRPRLRGCVQGGTTVWGAVGFRNGGGNDDKKRRDAVAKFSLDLDRALEENPTLTGFLFFTNVDLTPTQTEYLRQLAVVQRRQDC